MRLALTVALVMVAFAANSILNRLALESTGIGPASFAAIRLLAGALLLGGLVALRHPISSLRPSSTALKGAAMLGLYVLGFSFAYVSLASGTGALILFGGVQITMFLGAALTRETLPALRILGALVAFGGLVWLMAPGTEQPDPIGAVLMIAAAIGWGIFSLMGRTAGAPFQVMAASFLWCVPLGIAMWLLRPDGVDSAGAGLAILSGAVTSGLGYALWYQVLPKMPATRAAVAQLTVPIIAALGGLLFLAEPLTLRFVFASLLVLGGVGIALRTK